MASCSASPGRRTRCRAAQCSVKPTSVRAAPTPSTASSSTASTPRRRARRSFRGGSLMPISPLQKLVAAARRVRDSDAIASEEEFELALLDLYAALDEIDAVSDPEGRVNLHGR